MHFRLKKPKFKGPENTHHEFLVLPVVPFIIWIVLEFFPGKRTPLTDLPILHADLMNLQELRVVVHAYAKFRVIILLLVKPELPPKLVQKVLKYVLFE